MIGRVRFALALMVMLLVGTIGGASALVANGSPAPEIAEGAWINTQPLTMQALRGRVVLLDFWTFG